MKRRFASIDNLILTLLYTQMHAFSLDIHVQLNALKFSCSDEGKEITCYISTFVYFSKALCFRQMADSLILTDFQTKTFLRLSTDF